MSVQGNIELAHTLQFQLLPCATFLLRLFLMAAFSCLRLAVGIRIFDLQVSYLKSVALFWDFCLLLFDRFWD